MDEANIALQSVGQRIIDARADAVIFADRDGLIRLWNRGAELIFGYASSEVEGRSLDLIIPERLRQAHWDAFNRCLETGRTQHTDRVLTTRSIHKNGARLYVDLSFGLVKDDADSVVGAFAIGRDCTARYLADGEIKLRVKALEAQLDAAKRAT